MRRRVFIERGSALIAGSILATALPPRASYASRTAAPPTNSPEFGKYVMNRVDDMHRGESSHGVVEMTVKTARYERTIEIESWSKGEDYSLLRILSPKKERGTATLKTKGELFTYLNKTGRTIKITGGMMDGNWMGSHFTNNDLVRAARLVDTFDITLAFDGDRDGTGVYGFKLIPKPDAVVVWGRVDVTVRKSDLQPVAQLFYDEEGNRVRAMDFLDFKEVDGRTIATRLVMRPLDKHLEYTMVTYKDIEFGVALDPSFFTVQKLKSI